MAKKKGHQLRFCCDFRDLYSIDESLSKLGDAKFFTRRVLYANWDCFNGRKCPLASAMRQPPFNE